MSPEKLCDVRSTIGGGVVCTVPGPGFGCGLSRSDPWPFGADWKRVNDLLEMALWLSLSITVAYLFTPSSSVT
jgi:hypothetical protein